MLFSLNKVTYGQQRILHRVTTPSPSLSLSSLDMVDTQQLLAWPVGFSLNSVDMSGLDDSTHSLDMKHLSTLDYASISSSSIQSSLSPSLVTCISPNDAAYNLSPPQSEEHLTNLDYINMHSYRMEPDTQSKCSRLHVTLGGRNAWRGEETLQELRRTLLNLKVDLMDVKGNVSQLSAWCPA